VRGERVALGGTLLDDAALAELVEALVQHRRAHVVAESAELAERDGAVRQVGLP
jgi:hypothetical protein